jgi:hypothetical protein
MTQLTPAKRVAAYIQLRDYEAAAKKEFTKSMERVVLAMEKLEGDLLNDLNTTGADSLSCPQGTVYRNRTMTATVESREAFLACVRAHGLWEALDVKANKTFVKEYMDEKGEALPGLKITQFDKVGVRRK